MQRALTLFSSSIGKKALMAVSGVAMFGFLVGHTAGNLQIFLGPQKINEYSAMLHSMPSLLWAARVGLLASVLVHTWAAISLASQNSDARPSPYSRLSGSADGKLRAWASRSMLLGGLTVFLFIIYHVMHLTLGYAPGYQHSTTDVYSNLVSGFRNPFVTAFYVAAQLALGLHLFHGAWSWFQTLGLSHPKYETARRRFAAAITGFIVIGNIAIPTAVLTGVVKDRATLESEAASAGTEGDAADPALAEEGEAR